MLDGAIRVDDAGWHMSYIGGHTKISARLRVLFKLQVYAHQEFNNDFYKSKIQKNIDSNKDVFFRDCVFEIVDPDPDLPSYIFDNIEKFGHLFRENDDNS